MKKILIVLFFFQTFTQDVHAQSVELSVSPPVIEAIIAPNKKFSQVFHFKTSQSGVVVIPELHLVKPEGQSGHSIIDPKPVEPSSLPLVVTSTPSFNSRVNLTGNDASFTLTFEAPSSEVTQDVYLALVLRVEPKDIFEKSSLTSPAISSLILTTITKNDSYPINLDLKNFEPSLFHDSWLPVDLHPSLENSTSIMIRPKGKYEVISPTGNVIYSLDLYPNLILGNSSRNLESIIKDLPSSLSWQPKWSNIGPHKLKITIETQGGTKLSQTEHLFWIFPFRSSLFIMLFLIIIYRLTRPKQISTLDS